MSKGKKLMNTLNENIKKYRTQLGINQVELAKKLGVSKQCVSNWENDNVLPSIEMLVKLAKLFKISTDTLLGITFDNNISVDGLTEEQQSQIRILINEFAKLNKLIDNSNR